MSSIANKLSDIVGEAFKAQGLPVELGMVRVSDRPDLAQFQCNGAMAAAKQAKKNPREVAQHIIDALSKNSKFSKIEIAGPGFINLNVTDEFIQTHLKDLKNFGIEPTQEDKNIILDYGGPNIAKAMHVGHLRAAIIGDAVRRMMSFSGFKTLGDVHMGDWGTHMGMLIGDYVREGEQDLVLNTDTDNAEQVRKLMEDFSARYPKASGAAKEDEALMQEARDITFKLQNKEEPYYSIWQKIREISVEGMKQTYVKLGVHFDLWKGEADVHDYIEPMVEKMKIQGHAIEDDGAIIVPIADEEDNKKIPPMILYKRDGAVMYGTTDCATIIERMKLYDPARMVYIVDQRQSLHFEQVFRAVRKTGIVNDNVELTHAGFGTMNGTDGKPFKTRAGGVMKLEDLIAMAVEKAEARLAEANLADDINDEERADITHKVAIAAIKFADLQNQRQADYVFDLDRLTSFEGKTGPYVLYQAVRIKSLLAKANAQGFKTDGDLLIDDQDRDLALLLAQFPDILNLSIASYAPHHLCEYVYKLAQAFSSFYGNCHILSEEDEAQRASRLALCQKTGKQIETILGLLGIEVPDRM
jgi:arginyl-tRNA synthetase